MIARFPATAASPGGFASCCASVLLLAAGLCAAEVRVDTHEPRGHITISYQRIAVDGFEGNDGVLPIGEIDTHTLHVEVDYRLTSRWTLVAGIPFVRERYRGPVPHDPLALNPPRPDVKNIDTGRWNSDFQDFRLGARYLARGGVLGIEPFVELMIPSNDYPFFGHAAIGQNLWKVELGSSFTWSPGLSDAYYRMDIAHVFVEETLGVNVDHWHLRAEVGYFFSRHLSGRVFLIHKDGHGLTFPTDFPDRTNDNWYQHDRTIKHNFTNLGIGADWRMNGRYTMSSSLMTMTRAEQVHKMDYALTLALSRAF